MHLLWIVAIAATFTVAISKDFNLTELAVKSLKPFCGNETGMEKLKGCSETYESFQNGLFKCSNTTDYKVVEEKSCDNVQWAAQCALEKIPHTSKGEIKIVQAWHKCIGVDLSEERIEEFNKQLAEMQKQ